MGPHSKVGRTRSLEKVTRGGGQQTPTRLPVGLNAVGKGVIDIVLTKMALASQLEMGQEQAGRQAGCLWDDSGAY